MVSQMLSTQWPLRIFIHCGRVFKLCITSILIWFSIIQFVMHNFSLRRSCFSPRVYIIQKLVFGLFSSSANQIKATYKYYFCQSKHKKANITAITIFGDAMSVSGEPVLCLCVSRMILNIIVFSNAIYNTGEHVYPKTIRSICCVLKNLEWESHIPNPSCDKQSWSNIHKLERKKRVNYQQAHAYIHTTLYISDGPHSKK